MKSAKEAAEKAYVQYLNSMPDYMSQFFDKTIEESKVEKMFFIDGYLAAISDIEEKEE